jgi:hypothetical protein
MPTLEDVHAFARLDREIRRRLYGDQKADGLYKMLLSGNWENVCRTRGVIYAYEEVMKLMHEIAQAMTNEDRQAEAQPPRMN